MPEFIADKDGTVNGLDWDDLSPFVQGYLECVLFTETAGGYSMVEWHDEETQEAVREGQSDGNIPGDTGFGDFHPDTIKTAIEECEQFQQEAADLLAVAYGHHTPARTIGDGSLPDSHRPAWDYDECHAGHDFWLTRNGHGAGFWDRGMPDEIGEGLSDIAKGYGERNAWFSDEPDESSPTGYGFAYLE